MKNYAKIGKRKGRPAYRTAASFRCRKNIEISKIKTRQDHYGQSPASKKT